MKLLLTTRMGDPYFSLLDDLPDVQKVWATSPDEIAREIVDADVVYGWPTLEQFQAATRLTWIQVPSAGVEMLCSIPEIVLKKGKITAAGLDVFEQEPLGPDSELWDVPNLIMTPHLAGASIQKDRRCVEILRENLGRFQRGETLINLVDKRKGY